MTTPRPMIACLGAGRMGRGIAVAFAYAGHAVTMIDVKARSKDQFAMLEAETLGEIRKTLASLARFGLLTENDAEAVIARVLVVPAQNMAAALADAGIVFEGVPEVVDLKREVLASAAKCVGPEIIIASTTSTILVDDLSGSVEHPERFLNVHWLNPAYLIPLVEISPGAATDPAVITRVKTLLEGIGKVPVVCTATPGFIVPRIQALAMNEAARRWKKASPAPKILTRRSATGLASAMRCWGSWNSSTGAAATFSITPVAIWKAHSAATATARPK
jgi:3-hydroxybutyryl-CoA dehydrogenase